MMDAPTLFDLEPHGTPCMVCGDTACTCRAAGTLAAELTPWPTAPAGYVATRDKLGREVLVIPDEDALYLRRLHASLAWHEVHGYGYGQTDATTDARGLEIGRRIMAAREHAQSFVVGASGWDLEAAWWASHYNPSNGGRIYPFSVPGTLDTDLLESHGRIKFAG